MKVWASQQLLHRHRRLLLLQLRQAEDPAGNCLQAHSAARREATLAPWLLDFPAAPLLLLLRLHFAFFPLQHPKTEPLQHA